MDVREVVVKSGSKIVITGGAGFIGSHAAAMFAEKGWSVTVIDNLSRPSIPGFGLNTRTYNWDHLSGMKNVRRIRGSVLNKEVVTKAVRDADAVLHTAGQVAVTTSLVDPEGDFNTNMRGTFNVLEACRKAGNDVSLAFCSTNKVYGENVNSIPVKDEGIRYSFDDSSFAAGIPESFSVDRCKHSPYGASKLAADLYVQEYGQTYGLRTGCFRMSCIYGDRQFGSEDQGWVAHFALSAMLGRPVTIYGDGKQVRDVLYVDDVVSAYDAFIESSVPSNVFNIGGGKENTMSLLELIGILEKEHRFRIRVGYGPWRNSDQKVYISDISRAEQLLGWKPEVTANEGIGRLLSWARAAVGGKAAVSQPA